MADLLAVCSTGEDIIVFKSRDHVLLNIHRANLHAVTDGPFVVDLAAPEGDVADLPEDGDTLELMFRHVYPGRIPSLAPLSFQKLYTLAEASEKYRVGPAMNMCYTHLDLLYRERPLEVLAYAFRHGYHELMNKCAPSTVGRSVKDVRGILTPILIIAWVCLHIWTVLRI
ncbi:hypothetical protein EV714DRAFT_212604 [Schizophyllum commune]